MVKMAVYRAESRARELKSLQVKQKQQKHGHSEGVHCVVKRATGLCEGYDERKVYGSAYAACYVVLMNERECERIAGAVAKTVTKHVHRKKEMQSKDIARLLTKELKKHNTHAAFMYETHRDLA
ncbi:hypothetical protein HYU16_02660 [Candidatus Woesearchaeota archaeon]|nr:hypothetical protein [Candidatus Woesearchaeota archaeon]